MLGRTWRTAWWVIAMEVAGLVGAIALLFVDWRPQLWLVTLGIVAFSLSVLHNVVQSVTVSEDRITKRSLLGVKTIRFDELKSIVRGDYTPLTFYGRNGPVIFVDKFLGKADAILAAVEDRCRAMGIDPQRF